MPELEPVEPEKFPEVTVREWPKARLLIALSYWCVRVARRDRNGGVRPRFSYTFRMHQAELSAVLAAYYSNELKIVARKLDEGEQVLIRIQKDAQATGSWADPDA